MRPPLPAAARTPPPRPPEFPLFGVGWAPRPSRSGASPERLHPRRSCSPRALSAFALAVTLLLAACGRDPGHVRHPANPREAATQVEQAFAHSDPATRGIAAAVSAALRNGDYEQAVVSLQTIKTAPAITPDQGLAIHGTTLALEAQLIRALQSGDKNAERAYELLKTLKRN